MSGLLFSELCQSLNIPYEIFKSYENKGLKYLHPWQEECLCSTGALNGNNLLYCAPTGGGKTLVAEIVILNTVILLNKRAILILPYVSLVVEKEKEFRRLVTIFNRSKPINERIKVKGYHGESRAIGKLKEHIIVCTIEKANMIVNTLISRGQITQLGCIVVDEMHVLGDLQRGYHLEILISKLKYLIKNSIENKLYIQLIALSATIKNVEDLSKWFRAALYVTTYRPVPLREMVCFGCDVIDSNGQHIKKLNIPKIKLDPESLSLLTLCAEGLLQGQQIIIFCPSRNQCETTVRLLTNRMLEFFNYLGNSNHNKITHNIELPHDGRQKSIEKLKKLYPIGHKPSPSEIILETGILQGIAYHHAGNIYFILF